MLGRVYLKRAAGYAWISKYDKAIEDFERTIEFRGLYSSSEIDQMKADIERLKIR